jgi:hypothetical protein
MTFLALNGTTVRCKSDNVGQSDEEFRADRERMMDGTLRLTRQGIYREWKITTAHLSESDANTLLALVHSGAVLTASGDLVGDDVGVMPIPGSNDPVITATGFKRRVTFTLKETGGPVPADTSASIGAFYRSGVGYKKTAWATVDEAGVEALPNASDGDYVSAWLDQSGNRRHLLCGIDNFSFSNYADADAPTLDGTSLRFGASAARSTSYLVPTTSALNWWRNHTHAEVMVAMRPYDPNPVSDGQNNLWDLGRSGGGSDGNATYPAANGHLYETFASSTRRDLGVSTTDFSSTQVLSVVVDTLATSPNFIARIANAIIYQTTESTVSYPFFAGGTNLHIGYGQTSGYWNGWFKHLLVADVPMTAAQRRSWFDFMRGATITPPLP